MVKKILIIIGIAVIVAVLCFNVLNQNWHNGVGNVKPDCQEWFEDTGINVKSFQHRLFHIVRDGNGWLYYMSDVENVLIPVVNEFGLPTKDIAIFEP